MISCNQLRIGNYVLAQGGFQRVILIKETGASGIAFGLQDADSGALAELAADAVQPVPLNDDVLVQCGFVYHPYFQFWQLPASAGSTRSELDVDQDYNVIDFMRKPIVRRVSSLHQLQNVFFMMHDREMPVGAYAEHPAPQQNVLA
ncbi:MAG: hypothetical protein EOO11_23195 [Chitinophagaceae bacterium]|nr:MAG: hypothetical protein EOO11_23195 [Chitinophagaceae bacterium]